MMYCLVENGTVVDGPRAVPKSWRNTSGLDLLDDAALIARGWFPVTDSRVPPGPDQVAENETLTVVGQTVVRDHTVRDLTAEERRAKRDANDTTALRNAVKDIGILTVGLAEALVAKGTIAATDVEPVARQAYQNLKALADRLRA